MKQPNPKTVRFEEFVLPEAKEKAKKLGISLNKYINEAVKTKNDSIRK